MAKIIFTVDNINYKGGGHFATFKIANYLCSCGHGVILYSPVKAEASVRAELADGIVVSQRASFPMPTISSFRLRIQPSLKKSQTSKPAQKDPVDTHRLRRLEERRAGRYGAQKAAAHSL